MTLRVKEIKSIDTYLVVSYYELCDDKDKYNFSNYPDDYYKLFKLENLTLNMKIRNLLKINLFKSYEKVHSYYESTNIIIILRSIDV